ncbi:hypothetical protein N7456_000939 [Penicillium angulare]|uniref:DUF567 domain protein n=1 Tax=Penicillium angulare TaxID=116970 RepID=A0A9W9GD27_9EURO|nr:hypothetical protein N7456_000939 [Penicillium angulare]
MHSVNLAPVPQPLAIFDQFTAHQTEVLAIKEKVLSLTGDSFDVKLANGQPIFKVKGKLMSISGRKAVTDTSNNHLFDIVKEHLHIHSTYAAESPDGKKILQVKSGINLLGSKATATFTSPATGNTHVLKMKGNWIDSKADIVDESTNAVVAQIDRKLLSGRDIFFDQQTYAVIVAPGVDMALIAALCICFDEKNNEQD